MFDLVGVATGQSIELLGMCTEAIHNPLLMDRYLSLKSARYIATAARHLGDEIEWKKGGVVETRARRVLGEAHGLLALIRSETIWQAIAKGAFADIRRTREGGKGYTGVVARAPDYTNPFLEALEARAS